MEDYDKAIELDPNVSVAYHNRYDSYSNLGQYQRAIDDYDKAIELDPNDAEARTHRQGALGA
jgi:tetratricopeptide (TPR) repeat protein